MTERRPTTSDERGVALIWALLIMIIVLAIISGLAAIALNSSRDTRDANSRTRATFWAQAAAEDLSTRIVNGEVGPWVSSTSAAGQFLSMPLTSPVTPSLTTFTVPGASGARSRGALPLTTTAGGVTQRGWYQVLDPGSAARNQPWTGLRNLNTTDYTNRGSIVFVVRAWADTRNARPVVVRLVLRRDSLARFNILTEAPLVLGGSSGGLQSWSAMGRIHTNNTANANPAVQVTGAVPANVSSVSSTSGAISGCSSSKCHANVGDVVPFSSSSDRAFATVQRVASMSGRCSTSSFAACSFTAGTVAAGYPVDQMPVWRVLLSGGSNCVTVQRTAMQLRTDVGSYPLLNDRLGFQQPLTTVGNYCPAAGGGALLFDGDVFVGGQRAASNTPLTILARRTAAFPSRTVMGASVKTVAPASIWPLQTASNGGVGSAGTLSAVGLVAEGGVYFPSFAMTGVNDTLRLSNVAAMAASGSISYGPSIQAVASSGQQGLGVSAASARAMGYGYGTLLSMSGSFASAGQMIERYGAGTYLGYGSRQLNVSQALDWYSPPWYPTDNDWHLADWTEFAQ